MKTRLVQIGTSKALRIPKSLLAKARLPDDVEVTVSQGSLVIGPIRKRRVGWAAACARMRQAGDDELLDGPSSLTSWDQEEWEW